MVVHNHLINPHHIKNPGITKCSNTSYAAKNNNSNVNHILFLDFCATYVNNAKCQLVILSVISNILLLIFIGLLHFHFDNEFLC